MHLPVKRFGRLCCLLAMSLALLLTTRPADAIVIESGSFVDKVEDLRNLTFATGSGLYVAPTNGERADFATLADTLLSGDLVLAEQQAAALDYDLVEFSDTDTGKTYYGLTEQLVNNAQTRGWGSYFVNYTAATSPLVQVPHPRFDTNSWEIGAGMFQQAQSQAFMMAGAHRNSNGQGTADVAHLATSIFQEVHMTWNGVAGENMPWSIHGFNDANHNFPAGTDAVLSNGDGSVSQEVIDLDAQFEADGFETYAYNTLPALDPVNVTVNGAEQGSTFSSLGGTTNVQGVYSRGIGGRFMQIEMEQSIRFDANNRALAATALADAVLDGDELATCAIGDANCDGFVDVGNDIFPAFANFTGPGTFGMTRAEGDVQMAGIGGTTTLGVHDGDVDVSDILLMFSVFTGPPPPPDESGPGLLASSLSAAAAGDLSVPDLIYNAATGEVSIDLDGAVGMVGYVLNSANGFVAGGHTPFMAGVTTSETFELAEATFSTPAGPYPKSIGQVFPVGMNLATLENFLTGNQVSRGNNQPIVPFDLVVVGSAAVPEPATVVMGLTALLGLGVMVALRRKR